MFNKLGLSKNILRSGEARPVARGPPPHPPGLANPLQEI